MIYNKNTSQGGARSLGKVVSAEDSFITLQNNPTKNTNNYSRGNHISSAHDDAWYRWNGKYFTDSEDLGTDFTFGLTIMGEYSSFIDESKNFHYNVWPQFSYGNKNDEQWVQTYIGNDNYEPLGAAESLNPTDPLVQQSYTGRFYTDYGWYNEAWQFADPDTTYIPDQNHHLTMREAYEETKLPFWFLKFHVYLGEDNDAYVDITINGLLIYQTYIFEEYDTVNTPSIHIHTFPMHIVNYGVDVEGTPDAPYTGSFTYPRLIG